MGAATQVMSGSDNDQDPIVKQLTRIANSAEEAVEISRDVFRRMHYYLRPFADGILLTIYRVWPSDDSKEENPDATDN